MGYSDTFKIFGYFAEVILMCSAVNRLRAIIGSKAHAVWLEVFRVLVFCVCCFLHNLLDSKFMQCCSIQH